jgi:UDP:flavonoid glycosyltransferase YjiC (YdhE family)
VRKLTIQGGAGDVNANPACASPDRVDFEDRPLDLGAAARECDFAILNAGHGATAPMLLAGKPVLELPLQLEQSLTASAVADMGAGEAVPHKTTW